MRRLLPYAAYLLVVGMSAFGLWRIQEVWLDFKATACVGAWEGREQSRDMNEKTYRRNAETLVGLATSADPERIAAYQAQVERDVAEIRATLPDPDCDVRAARKRLGD